VSDLIGSQEVGVGFAGAPAEGAEFASHEADIGEIDVAIHDIGDEIAHEFATQIIRGHQQAEQIVACSVGQQQGLLARDRGAVQSR